MAKKPVQSRLRQIADAPLPSDVVVEEGETRERLARREDDDTRGRQESSRQFMALALERFKLVEDAEADLRRVMLDDLQFRAGEMWLEDVQKNRQADKRPCLTIDRISAPIRQVTNSQREASPTLKISPVDSGADVKTAEVLEGIVRHIEVESAAKVAYDTAFEHAVTMGRGYILVRTEWEDELAWQQRITIEAVQNPFSVYVDPTARKADKRDAKFGFVFADITERQFQAEYGDVLPASSLEDMRSIGDGVNNWFNSGSVRVAEYWYVDPERCVIGAYIHPQQPGDVISIRQDKPKELEAALAGGYVPVLRDGQPLTRETVINTVKWAKICGAGILEGNEDRTAGREHPGRYIPIIEVVGDELWIDGKRDLRGIVRAAKDPQRMYNVWVSSLTEQIGLAPRTPFIGAKGQFKGHEGRWQQANVRNFAYLEYNPVASDSGTLAPPPARQVYEPPIQAMVYAIRQADNDLKATTMLFDASLGQEGPEQSGKAILARQQQGMVAHAHFLDNLARAHGYLGLILLDMIPRIYDTPRVIRIIGEDNKAKPVTLNQRFEDNGVERIHDLSVGKYDVVVSMSRSFLTKRQEAVDALVRLVEANPAMFPLVGDLMVAMMDFPDAAKIAKRLEKTLPPELQPENEEGEGPTVQQLLPQLMQAKQQLELLQQALVEKDDLIRSKKMENASREYIAELNARTQATIAMAKIESQESIEQLRQQIATIDNLLAQNAARIADQQQAGREDAAADADRQHQMDMANMQHANAMQAQAAAQPPQPGAGA